MKRSVSFHLIQSYLPSILIVAVSWVSFWMDIESVPGRISLGVITLLAVSSQAGLGKAVDDSDLPTFYHLKALKSADFYVLIRQIQINLEAFCAKSLVG